MRGSPLACWLFGLPQPLRGGRVGVFPVLPAQRLSHRDIKPALTVPRLVGWLFVRLAGKLALLVPPHADVLALHALFVPFHRPFIAGGMGGPGAGGSWRWPSSCSQMICLVCSLPERKQGLWSRGWMRPLCSRKLGRSRVRADHSRPPGAQRVS